MLSQKSVKKHLAKLVFYWSNFFHKRFHFFIERFSMFH